MMTASLKAIVEKYNLQDKVLGDVALGAVIKHSSDWNLARECVIDSGLSIKTRVLICNVPAEPDWKQ